MHEKQSKSQWLNVHCLYLSYKSKNNKSENKLLKCPPLDVHTAVSYPSNSSQMIRHPATVVFCTTLIGKCDEYFILLLSNMYINSCIYVLLMNLLPWMCISMKMGNYTIHHCLDVIPWYEQLSK